MSFQKVFNVRYKSILQKNIISGSNIGKRQKYYSLVIRRKLGGEGRGLYYLKEWRSYPSESNSCPISSLLARSGLFLAMQHYLFQKRGILTTLPPI